MVPLAQQLLYVRHQAMIAIQIKLDFWDEAHIHHACKSGMLVLASDVQRSLGLTYHTPLFVATVLCVMHCRSDANLLLSARCSTGTPATRASGDCSHAHDVG